jgi:hypothetical protein
VTLSRCCSTVSEVPGSILGPETRYLAKEFCVSFDALSPILEQHFKTGNNRFLLDSFQSIIHNHPPNDNISYADEKASLNKLRTQKYNTSVSTYITGA